MRWLSRQFELHRAIGALHLAPMEGLRGFAVLLVFLVHYATAIAPWLRPGTPLAAGIAMMQAAGNAGVDLFFVLSGYLIYGALLRREQPYFPFLLRRLRRIYPAFTAVFLLYLALSRAFPAENKIPPGLADGAAYLAENFFLLNGFRRTAPMIAVAWSLSYEFGYYLVLPLLIDAAGLRRRGARRRVVFFLLLLAAGAAAFGLLGGPVRLLMFFAGILLHEGLAAGMLLPATILAPLVLASLPAALLTLSLPVPPLIKTAALFCAFYLLCHCCFAAPRAPLARVFSWTPLRWLGNMSFSFYLLHGLALKGALMAIAAWPPSRAIAGGMPDALFCWTLLPLMLLLAVLASAPLFLLIERPLSLAPRRARPAFAPQNA